MDLVPRNIVFMLLLFYATHGQKELGDIADGCPAGSYSFSTHCYALFTLSGSYDDAELACEGRGGILAIIKDPDTHLFIQKLRIRKYLMNYWIGLNDRQKEGVWQYSDGSRVQGFNRWLPGEPNNAQKSQDCSHMWMMRSLMWDDQRCDKRNLYICQFEARNCSENATRFGAYCLELSIAMATYDEAEHECMSRGGMLAAVKTQAMHDLLKEMIYTDMRWKDLSEQDVYQILREDKNGIGNSWIGIRYGFGSWVYSDGTPVTSNFTRWAPGEPNNAKTQEDCVMGGQDWYDVTCHNLRPFICQYDRKPKVPLQPPCPVVDIDMDNSSSNNSQSENTTTSTIRPTLPTRRLRTTTKRPQYLANTVEEYTGIRIGTIAFGFLVFGCFVLGAVCSAIIFGLLFYKSHNFPTRRERIKDDGQDMAILENEVTNPMFYVQNPAQDM